MHFQFWRQSLSGRAAAQYFVASAAILALLTVLWWQIVHPGASSPAFGLLIVFSMGPGILARRPKWTKEQVVGNQGSALDTRSSKRSVESAEQATQTGGGDGDLEYYIKERIHFFGNEEKETGLLVTEESGSFWAGTALSKKLARNKAVQVLLPLALLLAVISCKGASGGSAPGATTYTLAEALNAKVLLNASGQSISIGGDGPYTLVLWSSAGAANEQVEQTIQFGEGASFFKGPPHITPFVGLLINAQGRQLPMILDFSLTRGTAADTALATKFIDDPQTELATMAPSVKGMMVKVSDIRLQGQPNDSVEPSHQPHAPHVVLMPCCSVPPPSTAANQESDSVLPYTENDYVFLLA